MLSTMQDGQLSIATLLRYGSTVHGTAQVSTWTGESARRLSYAGLCAQAAQLAHALRGLGITGDQRVGTFMWNNNEHLEAYMAVPAMGAVLHTLNIRLFAEQVTYIANHAEDEVVLVDGSLVAAVRPMLADIRDSASRDRGRRRRPRSPRRAASRCTTTRNCWPASRPSSRRPTVDERDGRGHVLHLAAPPATPRASRTRTGRSGCTRCRCAWPTRWPRPGRPGAWLIVPMFHAMAWGCPTRPC